MAVKIPEFILSGMFVRGSLQSTDAGFVFSLKNTYAPATIHGFALEVDGRAVPADRLSLRLESSAEPRAAAQISREEPFPLPVNTLLEITVTQTEPGEGRLRIRVDTREVGELSFSVRSEADAPPTTEWPRRRPLRRFLARPLRASVEVSGAAVIGEVSPAVYGHFVEHLERCVYGGIWDADGRLNPDVVALTREIGPTVIRYPGGNFASDYHWEEGTGPKEVRPVHYDRAWHVEDPNLVGTDEFLEFCRAVGAEPYLVVNDGSGTPDEAARWVEYCNGSPATAMGRRRAANGRAEPYGVRYWGVGNEAWGEWQVGHTDARGYAERAAAFISAMRAVDPTIAIVAVGREELEGDPRNAAEWNSTVLEALGDRIDYLSFHVYQPSEEGYRPFYDPQQLYEAIIAAPLSVEDAICRLATRIEAACPGKGVGVALDEWNVKFPPPAGAKSMHDQHYTLRDALYVGSMLNVFHRQCRALRLANLAMLVNVLPAIVKPDEGPARFTPLAWPFMMYRNMEPIALECRIRAPAFAASALGLNISAKPGVPWLDATATRNAEGSRLVLGLLNRHPERRMRCSLELSHLPPMRSTRCRLLTGAPLATDVAARAVRPPAVRSRAGGGTQLEITLPAASLAVIELDTTGDGGRA